MDGLIAFIIIIGIFLLVAAMRSSEFKVERSIVINASPSEIFPYINDFHQWAAWSPWAKLDLTAKNTFEGAPSGAGSKFSWSGNNKVGAGSMVITDSQPDELIKIRVDFIKPFAGTNHVEFIFKPSENQTNLIWKAEGTNNYFAKLLNMFVNCQKMVGKSYEEGLGNIKRIVENRA